METIFKVVGKRRTKEVMVALTGALTLLLGAFEWLLGSASLALFLLPVVLYVCFISWLYEWRLLPKGPEGELVVDGQFILAGLMTLLWRVFLV
jgi:hypothetical protein